MSERGRERERESRSEFNTFIPTFQHHYILSPTTQPHPFLCFSSILPLLSVYIHIRLIDHQVITHYSYTQMMTMYWLHDHNNYIQRNQIKLNSYDHSMGSYHSDIM